MPPIMLRQGDVLLVELDELPSQLEPVPMVHPWREYGRVGHLVLARGEATGHAHVLEGEAELLRLEEIACEQLGLSRRWRSSSCGAGRVEPSPRGAHHLRRAAGQLPRGTPTRVRAQAQADRGGLMVESRASE